MLCHYLELQTRESAGALCMKEPGGGGGGGCNPKETVFNFSNLNFD